MDRVVINDIDVSECPFLQKNIIRDELTFAPVKYFFDFTCKKYPFDEKMIVKQSKIVSLKCIKNLM